MQRNKHTSKQPQLSNLHTHTTQERTPPPPHPLQPHSPHTTITIPPHKPQEPNTTKQTEPPQPTQKPKTPKPQNPQTPKPQNRPSTPFNITCPNTLHKPTTHTPFPSHPNNQYHTILSYTHRTRQQRNTVYGGREGVSDIPSERVSRRRHVARSYACIGTKRMCWSVRYLGIRIGRRNKDGGGGEETG
ncbi:hypothetical protein BDW02DRAFT_268867 [Decorospora gaudefroyi]|uniref:Uncharacterized protein n=1 Tax=Decorospora gaudefroyi TaxID=184978 RepID=A0A6A5KF55_9PLEO|nr:hypothetical protein BDW02DRAFT_268867 [Decorospora gaudefroyi]